LEDSLNDPYIPKYIQIYEYIKKEIETDTLKPGEKVYSEKEIMEKFNVSSTTARKSLEALKNENLIERIQGKGSFALKKGKVIRSLRKIISYTENMEKQGIKPSTIVLEKKIITGYTDYHKKLNLSKDDKILKLKRLKFGNDIPLAIEYRYINLKYCPDIYERDLGASLYKVYENYGIKIAHTKQFLELGFLDEEDARLLNCKTGEPAIYIEGLLSLKDYTPIEYEENFWNARVFKFQLEASL